MGLLHDRVTGQVVTSSCSSPIWPGWYSGRTIHIHFRVRSTLADGAEVNFTSQLYFEESANNAALATSDYQRTRTRDTTNSSDDIFDAVMLTPVTGNATAGYTGAFTVNLDFGDGIDGTADTDTTVSAAILGATVVRQTGGRRVLRVRLAAGSG